VEWTMTSTRGGHGDGSERGVDAEYEEREREREGTNQRQSPQSPPYFHVGGRSLTLHIASTAALHILHLTSHTAAS